jgi:hypothetical protein
MICFLLDCSAEVLPGGGSTVEPPRPRPGVPVAIQHLTYLTEHQRREVLELFAVSTPKAMSANSHRESRGLLWETEVQLRGTLMRHGGPKSWSTKGEWCASQAACCWLGHQNRTRQADERHAPGTNGSGSVSPHVACLRRRRRCRCRCLSHSHSHSCSHFQRVRHLTSPAARPLVSSVTPFASRARV